MYSIKLFKNTDVILKQPLSQEKNFFSKFVFCCFFFFLEILLFIVAIKSFSFLGILQVPPKHSFNIQQVVVNHLKNGKWNKHKNGMLSDKMRSKIFSNRSEKKNLESLPNKLSRKSLKISECHVSSIANDRLKFFGEKHSFWLLKKFRHQSKTSWYVIHFNFVYSYGDTVRSSKLAFGFAGGKKNR